MLRIIPSFPSYYASADGKIWRNGRVLTPRDNGRGYKRVTVSQDGVTSHPYVHQLVCEAFHGLAPARHECRHLNGIRDDNRADNLAWATKAVNEADKVKHGTLVRGERNGQARLTAGLILEAREIASQGGSIQAFAEAHNVNPFSLRDAVFGRRWKHLAGALEPYSTRRRLTDDQVREVRALAGKVRQDELAARFGVTQSAISAIVHRKSYPHVD